MRLGPFSTKKNLSPEMQKMLDEELMKVALDPRYKCVIEGQKLDIIHLLEKGANPNFEKNGRTPLGAILARKQITEDPSVYSEWNWRPQSENDDILFLLMAGAKITAEHMKIVIDQDDVAMTRFFMQRGVDVNFVHEGETPLIMAMRKGKGKIANLLMENSDAMEFVDEQKRDILMHGAACDTDFSTQLLRHHEFDLQACDAEKNTAFLIAAAHGNTGFARVLLEKGADITAVNNAGEDALFASLNSFERINAPTSIVRLLIAKGMDFTKENSDGLNCLQVATHCGHKDFVNELVNSVLERKKDLENLFSRMDEYTIKLLNPQNARIVAALAPEEVGKKIAEIKNLSDFDDYFKDLTKAAFYGDAKKVKKLIGEKDDKNRWMNQNYYTALNWAAVNGNSEITGFLIQSGVNNINVADGYKAAKSATIEYGIRENIEQRKKNWHMATNSNYYGQFNRQMVILGRVLMDETPGFSAAQCRFAFNDENPDNPISKLDDWKILKLLDLRKNLISRFTKLDGKELVEGSHEFTPAVASANIVMADLILNNRVRELSTYYQLQRSRPDSFVAVGFGRAKDPLDEFMPQYSQLTAEQNRILVGELREFFKVPERQRPVEVAPQKNDVPVELREVEEVKIEEIVPEVVTQENQSTAPLKSHHYQDHTISSSNKIRTPFVEKIRQEVEKNAEKIPPSTSTVKKKLHNAVKLSQSITQEKTPWRP